MWRGRDWKSSLPKLVNDSVAKNSEVDGTISLASHLEGQAVTASSILKQEAVKSLQTLSSSNSSACAEDRKVVAGEGTSTKAEDNVPILNDASSLVSGSHLITKDVSRYSEADGAISLRPHLEGQVVTASSIPKSEGLSSLETLSSSTSNICSRDVEVAGAEGTNIGAESHLPEVNDTPSLVGRPVSNMADVYGSKTPSTLDIYGDDASEGLTVSHGSKIVLHTADSDNDEGTAMSLGENISLETSIDPRNFEKPLSVVPPTCNELQDSPEMLQIHNDLTKLSSPWTEEVIALWKEAIEGGMAAVLDDSSLDADIVYKKAVALTQSAPRGPVFKRRQRKVPIQKVEPTKTEDMDVGEVVMLSEKEGSGRKRSINRRLKGIKEDYLNVVPKGTLGVDELAKLLA